MAQEIVLAVEVAGWWDVVILGQLERELKELMFSEHLPCARYWDTGVA